MDTLTFAVAVAAVVVGVPALMFVGVRWPQASIYATVVLAFTALPVFVPRSVGGLYLYELTLLLAVAFAVYKYRATNYVRVRVVALGLLLLFATVWGFLNGNATEGIIQDIRGPLVMLLGFVLFSHISGQPVLMGGLKVLRVVLWGSASLILLASVTGIELHGRTENAVLYNSAGAMATSTADRFLTSATHLALAVMCSVVALAVGKRAGLRHTVPYWMPALAIVFLSFSRNSILAVAVTALITVVACGGLNSGKRLLGYGFATLTAVGTIMHVGPAFAEVPLFGWLNSQLDAYSARVFEGLSGEALATDTSAQYRERETYFLTNQIEQAPILGHGFGHAYRPAAGAADSFTATTGIYYAHNFYLWVMVKAGIVGLLAVVWFAVSPVLSRLKDVSDTRLVGLGVSAGLLAVSFVAPLPLGVDSASALVIGGCLGLAAGLRPTGPREKKPKDYRPYELPDRLKVSRA